MILTGEPTPQTDLSVTTLEETYQGVPLVRLEYDYARRSVSHWAAYSDPLITAQIEQVIRGYQPDIIHATSLSLLMAGTLEAAVRAKVPLVYTVTDFVLTCRRGTYVKRDNSLCAEKEERALCTACMAPHTTLEKSLDWLWRLAPKALARPGLAWLEERLGKRADFVYAAESIQHRFNYIPIWRPRIDLAIAPSTYARDRLLLNGFPGNRIVVSPYGIDPPPPDFQRRPSDKLRFGFIGRLTYLKGVHLLIEAFSRLANQERATLTIYGRPDVKSDGYFQALQKRVAAYPTISFGGFVDNAAVSDLYREIDVLVVPSLWPENSPMTVLEALAHRTPVIVSDAPGMTDLVKHQVNGLVFTTQNGADLASQMERLLESPTLVKQLAGQCHIVKTMAQDAAELGQFYHIVRT